MDRLEALVQDTLAERAGQAPTGPLPLAERSRRPGRTMAILAGSLVVIAIAAVMLTLVLRAPDRTHPSTPASTPTAEQDLPEGMRTASYGSVSLTVPAGLATRTSLCGSPAANEVVVFAAATDFCTTVADSLAPHPGTVVWLSIVQQTTPYANIPTSPVDIDGYPGTRGYATNAQGLGTGVSGVIRLSQQNIVIGVTAPSRRDVDLLLSSIRIAQQDPLGCAANLSAASTTPPGPSNVLVPGEPTAAVRCEYGNGTTSGLLVGSYLLDPTQTDQLTTALNALVPDPCHCVHGGTAAPGHDEVLYLRYGSGNILRVNGAIGANLDTYTNQTRTVANYSSSITHLLAELTNQH